MVSGWTHQTECGISFQPGSGSGDGGPAIELDAPGKRRAVVQIAQEQVRVGDRRLAAAASVTGGTGLGSRRPGANAERAARV